MTATRSFPTVGMGAALALVAVVIPFLHAPNLIDATFRAAALVMIAVSWNMMAGAGLVSLGHSAFWGLGSYVAVLCANHFHIPFALSLVPAVFAGGLAGGGLALLTGRLRGIYFAIATLAFSEALRVMAAMLAGVTGGYNGLYLDSTLFPGPRTIDVGASLGAIAAVLVAWGVSRSRYAYGLRAMRDNEAASQMLGVAPIRFRFGIVALSGAIASLAGAINVWHGGYLDPGVAFDLQTTIDAQIAPILGGIYTLAGPIVGALATIGMEEATRTLLGGIVGASLLIYGLALIVAVLCLPQGIVGLLRQQLRRRRRPSGLRLAR